MDPFGAAEKRLSKFNKLLKATMETSQGGGAGGAPKGKRGTTQAAPSAGKAVDELAEANKLIEDIEAKTLASPYKSKRCKSCTVNR